MGPVRVTVEKSPPNPVITMYRVLLSVRETRGARRVRASSSSLQSERLGTTTTMTTIVLIYFIIAVRSYDVYRL